MNVSNELICIVDKLVDEIIRVDMFFVLFCIFIKFFFLIDFHNLLPDLYIYYKIRMLYYRYTWPCPGLVLYCTVLLYCTVWYDTHESRASI